MLIKFKLLCAFFIITTIAPGQGYNPIANPSAVISSGKARFTVLTDMLIRMEYAADSGFTDNATLTFVNRNLQVPRFETSRANGWLIIKTSYLQLRYKENSGRFNSGNVEISYQPKKETATGKNTEPLISTFTWKPGAKDKKNLKGTTRTLDGALGKFSFGQMKKLPIEDGIISRSGWAFIDDSKRPLFDNSDWPWVQARKNNNPQDWYFFGYGDNYKRALYDFVSTSGRISMPPKFAFGIWYSRYWRYTEQDMKDIVDGYAKNDIPLDVLVVDMDWHLTAGSEPELFKNFKPKLNGWTGFTWEKKYFPDYKEFLKWTDNQNLQTCLNLHPAAGVQAHEAAYPAFAKAMSFDTNGRKPIPFDITNKKFAQAYFDVLLHPYEKDGIDFWWLDWQQWGGTNIKGVNPTFYLNYVHYSDMQRQGKRPLIFHRYGGLGNQRYQIGFSGDCIIDWKSLSYQPEFTATAANVGYGYWSHDIGGHMNPVSKANKQNPELFTRWVQWGAFSPIFRTHATEDPEIERRIWKYPDSNFKAMRKAIQMRYALFPYIYTYARFAYDTGVSLVHPMYYEYPDLQEAYNYPDQYYFGNDMIVAPIHESMKGNNNIEQNIWLPQGGWYDYRNNNRIDGGGVITRSYTLDEIPVFVKAGSIIPTQTPKTRLTGAGSVIDTLILTVYPSYNVSSIAIDTTVSGYRKPAVFNLYEDDGTTEAYKQNQGSFTCFIYTQNGAKSGLMIQPDGKHYTGQPTERSYEIRIIKTDKPTGVMLNGNKMIENKDWSYDTSSHLVNIKTARAKLADLKIELF
jgi:alpha-glucosidase (family GH31 glycosyl hydrolase)